MSREIWRDVFRAAIKLPFRIPAVRGFFRTAAAFWLRRKGYRSARPIWLIACGGERWGDNASALYNHLQKVERDVAAVAVIKARADVPRDVRYVRRGSLENIALILVAEVLATTHTPYDLGPTVFVAAAQGVKVWLKHGVTGIRRHEPAPLRWNDFDLVCATSPHEARLLRASRGISKKVVRVTGFARHDRLLELSRRRDVRDVRDVLYMPTYREGDVEVIGPRLFSWIERFMDAPVQTDGPFAVKIWVHPTWRITGQGHVAEGSAGTVLQEPDVQNSLVASSILVTDYSSLAFDAAIIGIPVVFFQPDLSEYHRLFRSYQRMLRDDRMLGVRETEELVEVVSRLCGDEAFRRERIQQDSIWARTYISNFDGRACSRIVTDVRRIRGER